MGDDAILREAYSSLDQFWTDVIEVYRNELAALYNVGCTYLQVDETSLVKFGDPEIRAIVESRGDDWRKLVEAYVEVINAVLSSAPQGMTVGIHVCRGNRRGFWQAEAGYEFMSDQLFRRLKASFYFLEFDSPRAGPLDALKPMPDHKKGGGCGFSGNIGNTVMTADEQAAKLRLVVDTARTLWDEP